LCETLDSSDVTDPQRSRGDHDLSRQTKTA
jgi:hypothetical protein